MQSFSTSFSVNATPQAVFEAINNVPAWWGPIEGQFQKVGDEFSYLHGELHYSKHRVTDLLPGKKVVWQTVDSQLNFVEQKDEWNGTTIVFDITPEHDLTRLTFRQEGLTTALACYNDCSGAWRFYVHESLRDLILTGQGRPHQP